MFLTVLALNTFGEGVRRHFDRLGGGLVSDPLLRVEGLTHPLARTGRGVVRAVDDVSLELERGQDAGDRRRVGLGQDASSSARSWASSRRRDSAALRRSVVVRRRRPLALPPGAAAPVLGPAHRRSCSQNPMSSLNPVVRDRPPDHRGAHAVPRPVDVAAGPAAGRRAARPGRRSRPRAPPRAVPAPALRRPAPAGRRSRSRIAVRARPPDRRRADDGARRHRPGADPRPPRSDCSASRGWR